MVGTDFGARVGAGEECSDGGAGEGCGLPVGVADGGDCALDGVFLAEAASGGVSGGVRGGGVGVYRAWAIAARIAIARARVGYIAGERRE